MQHGQRPVRGALGDRIEQRIVRAPAGEQFDADRAALDAPLDLTQRVIGVIRIHRDVHTHATVLTRGDLEHRVVADGDVRG